MALNIRIRADASGVARTLESVRNSVSGIGKTFAKAAIGIGVFAAGLAGIAGMGAITEKIFQTLKDSSAAAASMETLGVQFETLTGSVATSAEMIAKFREEAQKSPLSVTDYANAGKTLLAFGNEAENIMPILKMLGDVSMGNSERFGSLSLAFAQTTAAGRLMGQEVLQFVNAGFNPLQQISKKTGRSMIELKAAMEAGAISSAMVAQSFKDATSQGGLFFNAIQRGAETFDGKVAQLKDSIFSLKAGFGEGLNQGLALIVTKLASSADGMLSAADGLGKKVGVMIAQAMTGDLALLEKTGALIGKAILIGMQATLGQGMVEGIFRPILDEIGKGAFDRKDPAKDSGLSHAILGRNAGTSALLSDNPEFTQMADELAKAFARASGFTADKAKAAAWKKHLEQQKQLVDNAIKEKADSKPVTFSR